MYRFFVPIFISIVCISTAKADYEDELFQAVMNNDLNTVKILVEDKHADVNAIEKPSPEETYTTVLARAIMTKNPLMISYLLSKGARKERVHENSSAIEYALKVFNFMEYNIREYPSIPFFKKILRDDISAKVYDAKVTAVCVASFRRNPFYLVDGLRNHFTSYLTYIGNENKELFRQRIDAMTDLELEQAVHKVMKLRKKEIIAMLK